jgi:hypothetical protein
MRVILYIYAFLSLLILQTHAKKKGGGGKVLKDELGMKDGFK